MRHHGGRRVEGDDVVLAQEMANKAVVLDCIKFSEKDHKAALMPMIIRTAVVIVQKRVN